MHRGDGMVAPNPSDDQLTDRSSHRSWHHSLFWIFLVALLLRVAVITIGHTYRITPRRDHFQFGWEMGRIARSIALGQGFSSPTDLPSGPSAWAPPIYPYLLAGIFKIFGIYTSASAWMVLAFNSLFSAFTCITLYRIADHMYGEAVARLTAWTWALFPYAIYWPVRVVWETSLTAYLLSLVLWMTLRMGEFPPRRRYWALYGVGWGIIVLTNTSVLAVFPLFLLWILYRSKDRARQLRGMMICGIVALAVVSPWLVRNYEAFGKFVFVRDNLPLEMHMANNDQFTGLWTRDEHPGNDPQAMRRFQQLGELRFMEEKQQEFRQFVREHPADFLRFTLQRSVYFWMGTPQSAVVGRFDLIVARHTAFLMMAALAFAGLWISFRQRTTGAFLLLTCLVVYPLPYYLVNPFPRYKHAIEPEMVLLGVYLLWRASGIKLRWPRAPKIA
jgi:4-amino-4-deoxy-L-arabinose transferase-like glycosyltransferase